MARPVMPTDEIYHAAVGIVALAHGHLELVQRFLVRALAGVDMRLALDSTEGSRISDVQTTVKRLAKERQLPEDVMVRLRALLNRARILSRKRHELVHRAVQMDKLGSGPISGGTEKTIGRNPSTLQRVQRKAINRFYPRCLRQISATDQLTLLPNDFG